MHFGTELCPAATAAATQSPTATWSLCSHEISQSNTRVELTEGCLIVAGCEFRIVKAAEGGAIWTTARLLFSGCETDCPLNSAYGSAILKTGLDLLSVGWCCFVRCRSHRGLAIGLGTHVAHPTTVFVAKAELSSFLDCSPQDDATGLGNIHHQMRLIADYEYLNFSGCAGDREAGRGSGLATED
jgi:hypothetical protein